MKLPLLIADAFESILGIVILVMAGLSQLLAARNPQGKGKPARPKRVPRPQGAGGAGGGGEDKLRQEVEDFLKRARGEKPAAEPMRPAEPVRLEPIPQQKPAAQQQAERERQMRRQRANQERKPSTPPRRTAPQRPTTPRQTPSQAQPTRLEPIRRGETVAEHVATHIDSHLDTAERVSHLGEEVGYADERLEEHLRTKFGHKLGSLERRPEVVEQAAGPTAADEVVDLLTRPGGMQQVIIANEILKRPEF